MGRYRSEKIKALLGVPGLRGPSGLATAGCPAGECPFFVGEL